MNDSIRLFELAGADDEIRFSPYCWRTRLALAHKGLNFKTIAWRFTEKEAIAASGQDKVPVLVIGERWLHDSWDIAVHLEDHFPQGPSLFGCSQGRATARFVSQWTNDVLQPAIARIIAPDMPAILHEKDRAYFRTTREIRFGCSLETLASERQKALTALHQILTPMRAVLGKQSFLAGDAPAYVDHCVFGAFQWANIINSLPLIEPDDPMFAWSERMLDAYGGIARSAKRCHA